MHRFTNHVFYTFKPIIPRALQIALRRQAAQHKRRRYAHIWPIDPNAGRPPADWAGWPGGKQFALVLSHDVDTPTGYDQVLKLADVEERLGFRSCFNFVPERYGTVSLELLDELRRRGFDIAVHGLRHDGTLFRSKSNFDRQAQRINQYIKEWNSQGFTSPSMHHNLEWLGGLNINFSISTFDTDPFEPQPDGVGTIFPFWVCNGSHGRGFVEMPYTLPQDSTLFIILQEKTVETWERKLDWVVRHGGMALLNTHPDYMDFGIGGLGEFHYPIEYYIRFIDGISRRYSGKFYHALPSAIAGFVKERHERTRPSFHRVICGDCREEGAPFDRTLPVSTVRPAAPARRALRVAMLTYSFYESDNRVRRYAETLVRRGDQVDVISLRREGQAGYNELNGVRVFRVQERVRDERGKWDYISRILKFLLRSAFQLTRKHLKRPYDIVHIHSVPDFEVFSALVPKLLGARIILDIHDIVPELYSSKFGVGPASMVFKLLLFAEKFSARFADHVIISNDLWRATLVRRSVQSSKCTSILNFPDDTIFFRRNRTRTDGKIIFLYPGTLNSHQGLDIAVTAFSRIKDIIPNAELHIYGDGPARPQLAELVRKYELEQRVFLQEPVPLEKIVSIMSQATVGIIPKRNNGFGGQAFSTKSLEFMSLGVPIIIARTMIDEQFFDDSVVKFFESENVEDLSVAMISMARSEELRTTMANRALSFACANSWRKKQKLYLEIINKLTTTSSVD